MEMTKKEKWYFIRQDIVSYLISTILYIGLCCIKSFSLRELLYSLFECLFFYVSFWYERIMFDLTYHSDRWKHCRFWTRTMLNIGVTILWMLPVRYSLFNGLLVSFICCLVLYLVAVEVKEKKEIKSELEKYTIKDIWQMNETELYERCIQCGLSDVDCKIANIIIIQRLKGKEFYEAINYSRSQSKRKRKEILNKLT